MTEEEVLALVQQSGPLTEFDITQLESFVYCAASGRFSEWPHLRTAVKHALEALKSK